MTNDTNDKRDNKGSTQRMLKPGEGEPGKPKVATLPPPDPFLRRGDAFQTLARGSNPGPVGMDVSGNDAVVNPKGRQRVTTLELMTEFEALREEMTNLKTENAGLREEKTSLEESLETTNEMLRAERTRRGVVEERLEGKEAENRTLTERIDNLLREAEAREKRFKTVEAKKAELEELLTDLQQDRRTLLEKLARYEKAEGVQPTALPQEPEAAAEAPLAVLVSPESELPSAPAAAEAAEEGVPSLKELAAASTPPTYGTGSVRLGVGRKSKIKRVSFGGEGDLGKEVDAAVDGVNLDKRPAPLEGTEAREFRELLAEPGSGEAAAMETDSGGASLTVPELRADAEVIAGLDALKREAEREGIPKAREPSVIVDSEIAAAAEPEEDTTETIDLDDPGAAHELKKLKEGKFWESKLGRVVNNIFVYGFAGKGDLKHPPISEEYENDGTHARAGYDYNSWYGKTGRIIRKVVGGTSEFGSNVAEAFRTEPRKALAIVATGVIAIGGGVTLYLMQPEKQDAAQRAAQEMARPQAAQVAVAREMETVEPVEDEGTAGAGPEPKPEPLAMPALADVLAKHNLSLEGKVHPLKFYEGMKGVTDVKERYVLLDALLGTEKQLERYEGAYSEVSVARGPYVSFLMAAKECAGLEGQSDAVKAEINEIGGRVAKHTKKLGRRKKTKERMGKATAAQMVALAAEFQEFREDLPSADDVAMAGAPEETTAVTKAELREMKKNGHKPEAPVIVLEEKVEEKPYDAEKEAKKVVKAEYEKLDTVSKVNDFNRRKVNKAKGLEDKFLLASHLSEQLVEQGMEAKMDGGRIIYMHLDAMNAAILFAQEMMEKKQMTAVATALDEFEAANKEVKRLMGYSKMKKKLKGQLEKIKKNVKWLRNRAKEMDAKLEAQETLEEHKEQVLPGSPAVDNVNGVPTVKIGEGNDEARQVLGVYAELEISITKHPLEIYQDLKNSKANSLQKFIVLQNLAERILREPVLMEGLTKGEKQQMIWVMIHFINSISPAVDVPKHFSGEYDRAWKIVDAGFYVADGLEYLRLTEAGRKTRRKKEGKVVPEHLERERIGWTVEMFNAAGDALQRYNETSVWQMQQKPRMERLNGNGMQH